MSSRILTLHPQGKQGVSIDLAKYNQVADTLREVLFDRELTFGELRSEIESRLNGRFDGSIGWYTTTIKLDLEARGEIERFGKSPQRLRIVSQN
ncbi:MAG: hypothetical protein L6Q98_16145 [Anaerolineae bacterium]|nr:hypothetical protein [Anaerolineae bacterium]NUQ04723.1 hypothetical protein [Anaerolineae bacterium]